MKVLPSSRLMHLILGLAVCALAQTSLAAGRVNGFETGDPAVTGIGDHSVQTSFQGQAAPEGTHQYLVTTINSSDGDGLSPVSGTNALTGTTFNGATVGGVENSGVLIPFNVAAGDLTLTLKYDFLSNEPNQTTPRADFAFWGIFNSSNTLIGSFTHFATASASFPSTLFGSQTPFIFHSGILTLSIPISSLAPGSYTLGLGVADSQTRDGASGLLIDNIQTVVPEPSTVALAVAGVAVMAGLRRWKARRA